MKIASFNINNVRRRLSNLVDWLRAAKPDIVCLQELKAADAEFPAQAILDAGYEPAWRGEKTWNGVAILGRGATPIVTRTALPGDDADSQSRYIEAAVTGILVASIYAPTGNPQPGPKFNYKLAWLERLARHAGALATEKGVPVVLAGDYNVVPTARDIYPTTSWDDDALLQPAARAAYRRIVAHGFVDAVRARHPDEPMYTYWDYKRRRWERDAGLRLDHILLSSDLAGRLVDAGVDRAVRGEADASDHAPVWIELRDAASQSAGCAPKKPARATTPAAPHRKTSTTKTSASKPIDRSRPLLVIDGDSFTHRAYHGLPKTILRRGGKGAGAILGFANFLLRLYESERPRAVLVGWDTLDVPNYRHKAFPAYQSGRDFDDALLEQLDTLPEFVAACGFANAKGAGYEADDFVAAAAAAETKRGGTTLVASGDRDMFQLASAATTVIFPIRAGEMARIGPPEVRERYGVDPAQVPDFIALRGDPSDKLPGAPGVGPKGAASLLRQYGTLEAMLVAGRFAGEAKALRLYRSIATMDATAPLPPLPDQEPTWTKAAALAREWELNRLAGRLAELAKPKPARGSS